MKTVFKNFFPSSCGLITRRSGFKPMPLPSTNIFHRIGVKLGIIPQTTFVSMMIHQDRLFVATNYGVFVKDEKDVFHPLKFIDRPAQKGE